MDHLLISADSHVIEPVDLFETALGEKYGDAVPRELTISASGPRGTQALNAIRAAALVR